MVKRQLQQRAYYHLVELSDAPWANVSLTEVVALAARYRNRIIVPPYLMQERQSYTRLVSLPDVAERCQDLYFKGIV